MPWIGEMGEMDTAVSVCGLVSVIAGVACGSMMMDNFAGLVVGLIVTLGLFFLGTFFYIGVSSIVEKHRKPPR